MARTRRQPPRVSNGGNVRDSNSAHRTTQNHRFGAAVAEVKNPRNYRRPNNPFRRNGPSNEQFQSFQASFNRLSPWMLNRNVQQYTPQYTPSYSYGRPEFQITRSPYYEPVMMAVSNHVSRNYDHNSNLNHVPKTRPMKPAPRQDNVHGRKPVADNRQTSDCAICLDKPVNSALYGCGHMSMCYDCAVQQWRNTAGGRCPICRAAIRDVIRVYKS